jgi:hypothetical protein
VANATVTHFNAVLDEFRDSGIDPNLIRSWADHEDHIVRRNRHQVIASFPLFAALVALNSEIPVHMEIGAAIDRGDPLVEALSSILKVGKKSIRFLRGKGPALIGADWLDHPSELLEAVDSVLPEKQPRSRGEWKLFREFWVGCGDLTVERYCRRPSPSLRCDKMSRHLLQGLTAAGYEASAQKLRRLWHGDLRRLADVKDYFRFVAEWCEAGAGLCGKRQHLRVVAGNIRDDLLMRYSAMELIRQSERWHREISRAAAVALTAEAHAAMEEWPALPGLPMRVGNLTVFSLTSTLQLQLEGTRLNHCVSTYVRSCMYGESHIVSIRDADGGSLSTADISIDADERGKLVPNVIQHQAHSNLEPSRECEAALAKVLDMLITADTQARLQEIGVFHVNRRDEIDALMAIDDGGYPVKLCCEVMSRVLRDYDKAIDWLDRRLEQEEGWYRHRNEQAGERLEQLGFDDELTDERAFEIYRDTGIDECLDAGIMFGVDPGRGYV